MATLLDACKSFEVLKKIANILQVVHERFYEVANKINKELGMFVCITSLYTCICTNVMYMYCI